MTEFVTLRPKTCSCLINDGSNDKKAKGTKSVQKNEYSSSMIIKIAH